jgi:hypothetical protein
VSLGAQLDIDGLVVRASWPRASDARFGRGVTLQTPCLALGDCDPAMPTVATIRNSLIQGSHEHGVIARDSTLVLETSVVRDTYLRAAEGYFGDGVIIAAGGGAANGSLFDVRIDNSARGGVVSFGSPVSVGNTHITCAAIPLAGEDSVGLPFEFSDLGGNACGCPMADGACKAESAGLTPPEAL